MHRAVIEYVERYYLPAHAASGLPVRPLTHASP